jgi:hypothetical protein
VPSRSRARVAFGNHGVIQLPANLFVSITRWSATPAKENILGPRREPAVRLPGSPETAAVSARGGSS